MEQSPLMTVAVWQKKSAELSFQNKDLLISAVNKGFNALAAILSKDSDPDEVQCALDFLSSERSIALKYDKSKDDSLRDLVYGLLESLHVSLIEWTEERNQKKETGEISTQAEEESPLSLLGPLIPPCESSILIDKNPSNDLSIISASELMRDEKMFKEEEMDNENKEEIIANSHPISLDHLDQNSGMGDAVNDSLDDAPLIEDHSALGTMQPSDVMEYQMNFDDEISGDNDQSLAEKNSLNVSMSDSHMHLNEISAPEIDGEERDLSANNVIDNEEKEEEAVDLTDVPKDTSDTPKNEKRKRSSRHASGPIQYTESMEDSDGDVGPSVKKSRSDSTGEAENKRRSYKGEVNGDDGRAGRKNSVSKKNDTELECPECEYRTWTVRAWMMHLRKKHSTTPALAGLALLCECGNESVTDSHIVTTNHSNTTVIRKRNGPIRRLDDDKATPKCVLCEMYPKTAHGYAHHLQVNHKSTLLQNGVYLKCSCGLEVRWNDFTKLKHLDDCNPRQFSLHKLDGK